jgi:proton-dependent oligopeptide transporter, POT family
VVSAAPATTTRQPRGLWTLFLTEMWERFTYYGMRSILILFLVASVADGGLGFDDQTASAIYGLYIAATYVFALLGGWIADRLIGAQRAVTAGAGAIIVGNGLLAAGGVARFFLGLLVIVLGVGLLKPNISAMVGQLYPEGGSRRDAGFTIFYTGISVGALLASILVPLTAAHFGWRSGFGLAAIGTMIGLGQFLLTRSWLGTAGEAPAVRRGSGLTLVVLLLIVIAVIAALALGGWLKIEPIALSAAASWVIAACAAAYFIYLLAFAGLSAEERRRIVVVLALFLAYATFYAGFEQGGASLNLFADRYTDRHVFGWLMPAGVLQGVTALITIVFAPLFALLWIALGRRGLDPAPPLKFAAGLALLGLGFLVMYLASQRVLTGIKVLPTWLLLAYLLQEFGDLCLSPVGLSSMTKLAPQRFAGQVMGVWFLALALGNNLAGQLSQEYDAHNPQTLVVLFLRIVSLGLIGGLAMLLLAPWLKRLTAGVK